MWPWALGHFNISQTKYKRLYLLCASNLLTGQPAAGYWPSGGTVAAGSAGGAAASFSAAEGGGSVACSASISAPLQLHDESRHPSELFMPASRIHVLQKDETAATGPRSSREKSGSDLRSIFVLKCKSSEQRKGKRTDHLTIFFSLSSSSPPSSSSMWTTSGSWFSPATTSEALPSLLVLGGPLLFVIVIFCG